MVSRDLLPMAKGCTRLRGVGKPLQIAADDATGTTEAAQHADFQVAVNSTADAVLPSFWRVLLPRRGAAQHDCTPSCKRCTRMRDKLDIFQSVIQN
jgi:hypothetical protein